jgi:hypothetical protein
MLRKKPARVNIGIDKDVEVVRTARGWDVPGLTVINNDAISYLPGLVATESMHGERVFVYLDPPYLFETRGFRKYYQHEFGEFQEHEALLDLIKSLPCMVAISGYWSLLYSWGLADWRCISWDVSTRGHTRATEYLWMNYEEPAELHDYRFLGDDFREREKLAKVRRRWVARLARMDRLERLMLMEALSLVPAPTAESGGAGQASKPAESGGAAGAP